MRYKVYGQKVKELRELSTLQKKIYALDYLDFKNSRRSK